MSRGRDTRAALLESAQQIVLEEGPDRLTLDAVAARTGVSKGGVLYHFPSKDALLAGLLGRAFEAMKQWVDARVAGAAPGRGAIARAYIDFVRAMHGSEQGMPTMGAALYACAALKRELLAPFYAELSEWLERMVVDGVPRDAAGLVWLTLDGAWLNGVLGTFDMEASFFDAAEGALRLLEGVVSRAVAGADP
jgi:AcrR family transcriptional regulator